MTILRGGKGYEEGECIEEEGGFPLSLCDLTFVEGVFGGMDGEVVRSLYRTLYRGARQLDRVPASKALLRRPPSKRYGKLRRRRHAGRSEGLRGTGDGQLGARKPTLMPVWFCSLLKISRKVNGWS